MRPVIRNSCVLFHSDVITGLGSVSISGFFRNSPGVSLVNRRIFGRYALVYLLDGTKLDLDPERLVFIDETWASTNMARRHGRCRRGERLRSGVPHGHWKTTTLVAGLRRTGMVAPMVLDGPINRDAFVAYVR